MIVPLHRELVPGTLRSILRQAELTLEEFVNLVKFRGIPDPERRSLRLRQLPAPMRHMVDIRLGPLRQHVLTHLPRRSLLHPRRLVCRTQAVSNRTPFTPTKPSCRGSSITMPV